MRTTGRGLPWRNERQELAADRQHDPVGGEGRDHAGAHRGHHAAALHDSSGREGGRGDERRGEHAREQSRPRFGGRGAVAVERRDDVEGQPAEGRHGEARAQEQVDPAALDGEPRAGEHRDRGGGDGHRGLEGGFACGSA